MNVYGWIAFVIVGILSFWQWDHGALSVAVVEQQRDTSQAKVAGLEGTNKTLTQALLDKSALETALNEIRVEARKTRAVLDGQTSQIRQDITELKRTDADVKAYLSGSVPAALGVRYARPATTDPVAWRAGSTQGLRPGAVPATGPPSAKP